MRYTLWFKSKNNKPDVLTGFTHVDFSVFKDAKINALIMQNLGATEIEIIDNDLQTCFDVKTNKWYLI